MVLHILIAATLAQAAAPPADARLDQVTVVGRRDPFRLDARALRAAQAAWARDRAAFAPAAPLVFTVEARGTDALPKALYLTDGTERRPVSVDADGRFVLPAIPEGKWWLTADRARRAIAVRPLILSPGATPADHRLGDARLQCRVFWAMMKANAPLLVAPLVGTIDLVGACGSKRIGIYARTPRPVLSAVVREGDRVVPVEVAKTRRTYRLPLADRSLGNDARVGVTFE